MITNDRQLKEKLPINQLTPNYRDYINLGEIRQKIRMNCEISSPIDCLLLQVDELVKTNS